MITSQTSLSSLLAEMPECATTNDAKVKYGGSVFVYGKPKQQ
jgi:hypothetical protein